MGSYDVNNTVWSENIYTFDNNDPVQGGSQGVDNKPLKELANNTASLKKYKSHVIQGSGNPNSDSTINSLTALQDSSTYAIQTFEIEDNYIQTLLYFDYTDGSFWRFKTTTGIWENLNADIDLDVSELRINKDGDVITNESYYSLKTETIDGAQRLVLREFPQNQLADLAVGTLETNSIDGTTEVTNIVDQEVLLLADNTDTSNQDAQFAIKRLLDIGITISKVETSIDETGLDLPTDIFGYDRFTVSYDGSNGALEDYIDPDNYDSYMQVDISDTGYSDISGYYRIAKVELFNTGEYYFYTYKRFNKVFLDTGESEVNFSPEETALVDVSSMLQWVNSPLETGDEDGYFQLTTRQGRLLGLNAYSIATNNGDFGDIYNTIITNQAQFDDFFTTTVSSTDNYVIIKQNQTELSNGYYELDRIVEITGNRNTLIFHDGARIKLTNTSAGFKINCDDIKMEVNFDTQTVGSITTPLINLFNTNNCDISTKIFNITGDVGIEGTSNTTNVNLKYSIDASNVLSDNVRTLENVNCNDIFSINDNTGGKNFDTCTNINIIGFIQGDAYIGYGNFDF
jgi:hypothetical protein